jgi:hypothetical protein
VFLINSRLDLFTAATSESGRPFSRSYGSILPSSLAMNLSSTLEFSSQLPVSVYGTGSYNLKLRGFSWKPLGTLSTRRSFVVLSTFSKTCGFTYKSYSYSLQRTIPSVRGAFNTPSPHRNYKKYRNINLLSIDYSLRIRLRSRLTLS